MFNLYPLDNTEFINLENYRKHKKWNNKIDEIVEWYLVNHESNTNGVLEIYGQVSLCLHRICS